MPMLLTYIKNLFTGAPKVKALEDLQGWDRADAILHNLSVTQEVPGMGVTALKEGRIVLQKGYGYAHMENKTPMDAVASKCRVASISKCITGLALGKMVEQGILAWDDSVYKYVPYFPKKRYDFTLRQLAAHTAGIRGYRGKEFALNKSYSIKESLEVFKDDPLLFEPGKGYHYNSFDFVLLSLAMQEASRMPFEAYVKKEVLEPLQMTDTVTPREESGKNVSVQHYTKNQLGFKKAAEVDNFYKLAGGGYMSTSADIAKLGQAILEQQLLSPETYKELLTPQMVNGTSSYYGLGFQVSKDRIGRPFVGHVGSSVGAYSNLFVYPKAALVIAVLVNCTDPKIQDQLDQVSILS